MQLQNSSTNYSTFTKLFHWTIAILVILMFFFGILGFKYVETQPLKSQIIQLHKSIGLTIFLLMLVRLGWRALNMRPPLPKKIPHWQRFTADANHYLFYIILILMPLSGWIMSVAAGRPPKYFGIFTLNLPIEPNKTVAGIFAEIHLIFAWGLAILIIIHVSAALKHHFYDKTNVLRRMWFFNKAKE